MTLCVAVRGDGESETKGEVLLKGKDRKRRLIRKLKIEIVKQKEKKMTRVRK